MRARVHLARTRAARLVHKPSLRVKGRGRGGEARGVRGEERLLRGEDEFGRLLRLELRHREGW